MIATPSQLECRRAAHRSAVVSRALITAALALLGLGLSPARGHAAESWDYSPYQIRIWVTQSHSPDLGAGRIIPALQRALVERGDVHAGSTWDMQVAEAPEAIRHDLVHYFDEVTVEQVMAADEKIMDNDKLYILAVDWQLDHYVVRCRELDCRTHHWGRVRLRTTWQPQLVERTAFRALADAFTPLVRIEKSEGNFSTARLRAGGLILEPESPAAVTVHDVLLPIVRTNNRYGKPLENGINVIPFTFLLVAQQKGSLLACRIHSGMGPRSVAGRTSSRTQRFGLLARPESDSSNLTILDKVTKSPLGGYDIYSKYPEFQLPPPPPEAEGQDAPGGGPPAAAGDAPAGDAGDGAAAAGGDAADGAQPGDAGAATDTDEPPKAEKGEEPEKKEETPDEPPPKKKIPPELLGRSDWRGMVDVPKGEQQLRLVYIKSGDRLLARLPIVPGLFEQLTAEVANDDLRLEAESFVAGLRSKIMDLVARRAVLASRIRLRISEDKVSEAEEFLVEFRNLPSRDDLIGEMDKAKQRFDTRDRVAKAKIDRLFADTRTLINRFIEASLDTKLDQEVKAAKGS